MSIPSDPVNIYDDAVIRDPWPHYERLRAKGPVVWMEALGNYAFTHYDSVRAGLRDHQSFISGLGAAADDFGCQYQRGNTVASDPPLHDTLRNAISPPLALNQIEPLRETIQNTANRIIEDCASKGRFDAMRDLAQPLPLAIVRDLVGLPDFGRENMLKWASAAFDMQGIQNDRGIKAQDAIAEMRRFAATGATPDKLKQGSWTHRITQMVERGDLDPALAPFAIRDYINPSLDTTISALGHLLFHLGTTPGIWDALKDDPTRAQNAAHEAVRIGTPIRAFSRTTSKEVKISGQKIPKGERVMMLYASANRDEAVFPKAHVFDLHRKNARRHLAFGAGIHMCVGMHLAILEIECMIHAMVRNFDTIQVETPTIAMNNSICAYKSMSVSVVSHFAN